MSLEYTYSDYYERVSKFLGTGTTPTGTPKTDAQDIVTRAYKRFLYPVVKIGNNIRLHTWSFLSKSALFPIISDTSIYVMPTDYGNMEVDFTYTLDDNKGITSLQNVDEASMLRMMAYNSGTGEPIYYTIRQRPYNKETGQLHEVLFYPVPNGDYTFAYQYNVNPPKLSGDDDVPMGGIECGECLMQMCLAVAAEQEDEVDGVQSRRALELLMATVQGDKERNAANTVGYNGDPSDNSYKFPRRFKTTGTLVSGYNVVTP